MRIERDGEAAIIHLHGGRANAMDEAFLRGLIRLFDEVESSDARVAVLTGYETFFSAGLALPSLIKLDRQHLLPFMELFEAAMRRVFVCRLPVVAAVNGHAIAGGCVLALQCDARLMADAPLWIGLNEVQIGIALPAVVIEPLRLAVPPSALATVALEGRLHSPAEAQRLGLVDQVVAPAELLPRALERARSLAAGTREALACVKEALRRPSLERMDREAARERERWLEVWFGASAQERIGAVVARLSSKR